MAVKTSPLETTAQDLWAGSMANPGMRQQASPDLGGGMGITAGGQPSLLGGSPQLIAPQAPQTSGVGSAFDIIHSGGTGAIAGTAAGGWVGTIIGAVLGLAEGIVGAAVGSSSDQRKYNAQLQAFNNQMRNYYEHANNVIESLREQRKEVRREKELGRRELERRIKLDAFLTGRKMKEEQRIELAQRWR
jgi:hypothetical protein